MTLHLQLEIRDSVPVLTIPPSRQGLGFLLRSAVTKGRVLDHETIMSIVTRRDEEPIEVELNANIYISAVKWMFREYESERNFYLKYIDTAHLMGITPDTPEVLPITFNGEFITSEEQLPRLPDRLVRLGSFELSQPTLRISDPCYEVGTWCADTTEALPGTYDAYVFSKFDDGWNQIHRPGLLAIFHESVPESQRDIEMFRTLPVICNAGVDSGQCGFYDDAKYPRDREELEYDDTKFYGRCCNLTLETNDGGGIIDGMGVVSMTFIGDGGYPCYALKNEEGLVIAACLDYSWHFSEDEEGYEDDDYCDENEGLMLGCEREGNDDEEDAINCQNDGGF